DNWLHAAVARCRGLAFCSFDRPGGPKMMGRQVVFAIAIVAAAHGPGRAQEPPHFYNPAWSPDSRQIVFESNREGKDAIYRINADGSGLVRLTPIDANSFQPSWSHDG